MKTIDVQVGSAGAFTISAHVYGLWAAHERLCTIFGDQWTVTHVPSGMALPYFENVDERTAKETARLLGECRIDGKLTEEKLTGEWRCALEAIVAPASLGDELPWVAVHP